MDEMPQTPMLLRLIVRDWLNRSDALSALPNAPVVPADGEAPRTRSHRRAARRQG